ncbi:AAA family ATPase [Streptomyces sp. NPDC008121]|uniref:helix-turn-helix transcriptional regulator n=1 Tax=Streptomyces sp. NPDC008121 TaxID=3364809 RepID=UPI0036DFC5FD
MEPRIRDRDQEIAVLEAAVRSAASGEGRFLLLHGPAGIGKSRLLGEGRERGRARGLRVLSGRASRWEQENGFGLAGQIVGRVVPTGERHDASFPALDRLHQAVVERCERSPLLLALDDLQWADEASLRFLAYLLPRMRSLPLLVIAGARPPTDASSGSSGAFVDQLAADDGVTLLRPRPLSAASSLGLADEITGTPLPGGLADSVHRLSGGNPLLVRELARTLLQRRIDPSVADADALAAIAVDILGGHLRSLLGAMHEDAAELARAMATLGEGAAPHEAASLAHQSVEVATRQLSALRAAGILRDDGSLGFAHPLAVAALRDVTGTARLTALHGTAAEILHRCHAENDRVASHLVRSFPLGAQWAAGALENAARDAVHEGKPAAALAFASRRLQEPFATPDDRVRALVLAGEIAQLVDHRTAVTYLRAALDETGCAGCEAALSSLLGRSLFALGRPAEALTPHTRTDPDPGPVRRNGSGYGTTPETSDSTLINFSRPAPRSPRPTGGCRHASARPRTAGDQAKNTFLVHAWHTGISQDATASACAAAVSEALDTGMLLDASTTPEAVADACWVLAAADDRRAETLLDERMDREWRQGSDTGMAVLQTVRSLTLLRRGVLAEAEECLRAAMERIDASHAEVLRPLAAAFLAECLREQGRGEEARSALDRVHTAGPRHRAGQEDWLMVSRAELLLAEGEGRRGSELLRACGARASTRGWTNPAFLSWRAPLAQALHTLGRIPEARALAFEEVALASHWGGPRSLGRAQRVAGTLVAGDEGFGLLQDAVATLGGSSARLEYAKALTALGCCLGERSSLPEASTAMSRALDIALTCHATTLADRIRHELGRIAARAGSAPPTGLAALTPSERRVAELAGRGSINREIAAALFIAPKTVEVHLTNIYRKLAVRNRGEMARKLRPERG